MLKARTESGRTILGITPVQFQSLLREFSIPLSDENPLFREDGHHNHKIEFRRSRDSSSPVSLCKD